MLIYTAVSVSRYWGRGGGAYLFERTSERFGDHEVDEQPRNDCAAKVDPAHHRAEVSTVGVVEVWQGERNSPSKQIPRA